MATKVEILDLLKRDVITMDEAVEMLNKLEPVKIVHDVVETPKVKTYKEKVEDIVQNAVNDIDFEKVFSIMKNMNWTYGFDSHPITREEVRSTMEMCVRSAVRKMVYNGVTDEWFSATIGTGGFEAHACVDEGDTVIQVELKFIPYTGFGGDTTINELVSNYTKEDQEEDSKQIS